MRNKVCVFVHIYKYIYIWINTHMIQVPKAQISLVLVLLRTLTPTDSNTLPASPPRPFRRAGNGFGSVQRAGIPKSPWLPILSHQVIHDLDDLGQFGATFILGHLYFSWDITILVQSFPSPKGPKSPLAHHRTMVRTTVGPGGPWRPGTKKTATGMCPQSECKKTLITSDHQKDIYRGTAHK